MRMSYRPGCPCCNSKHLHANRARKSATDRNALRNAKRRARAEGKREIQEAA